MRGVTHPSEGERQLSSSVSQTKRQLDFVSVTTAAPPSCQPKLFFRLFASFTVKNNTKCRGNDVKNLLERDLETAQARFEFAMLT